MSILWSGKEEVHELHLQLHLCDINIIRLQTFNVIRLNRKTRTRTRTEYQQ